MNSEQRAAIQDNPLVTRQDLALALEQLTAPLGPLYSPGGARLRAGRTGASYPSAVAEMEGFSRVLWGLVPLLMGGGSSPLLDTVLDGIRHGTDPAHDEYWGDVADYDQRLVEMAVFGFALAAVPEKIWTPLAPKEQKQLYSWLNQINAHPCYDCNWLFFNVLVNAGFKKLKLTYDEGQLETNLQRMDAFYLDEGWYSDGVNGHSDYYVPFAIHYYGLLYAKLMEQEDPERSALFKERARLFAPAFISWFAPDGSALPYGRSLAYRFAQSAFWSAYAYAEVEGDFPAGVVKGLVLRNLRWWFSQEIVDRDGVLTIGYTYPNLVMAENYNAPGSPYWALKTFLPLAFSEEHPFWKAEELPLPELPAVSVQQPAHLVMVREAGHVAAFNSGHLYTNEHTHTSAKYEKFVYSTGFGFSVPRAEWGLSQGAFDSMLALSEGGDNLYRVRRRNLKSEITDNVLHSVWKPWSDVEVRTWIIAGLPWHIRVHRIAAGRALDIAEGGFALGQEAERGQFISPTGAAACTAWGATAIKGLLGYSKVQGKAELIMPNANTNLLRPRTVLPTLTASLEPGVHWLVSAVYGDPAGNPAKDSWSRQAAGILEQQPELTLQAVIEQEAIKVITVDGKALTISMD
ncbi:hypothetical protein R70723_23395 [Paenibacillus sp. FSL R7-0273]|uniref:DUF2264 domain-containing protein n=1 Tax=Paenibacillus sp. FSL R7-0273 TaxID=1536772 RepID=UPI0004F8BB81|nr:DUF2264 domain-containing protein [Paenibacillus sp. FSL R7-0273]AIQ48531.1 hypothetical protein R70723_23395 [Paenibacillus sp. FSL R7-0273]OMF87613.1 hypothetical protein BK144_23720 [Paenibacillus sp. FSL R7-0273]